MNEKMKEWAVFAVWHENLEQQPTYHVIQMLREVNLHFWLVFFQIFKKYQAHVLIETLVSDRPTRTNFDVSPSTNEKLVPVIFVSLNFADS